MPKIGLHWAIPVTCIGYILSYDVFGILLTSVVVFHLWNVIVSDLPKKIGYVSKAEYDTLKQEQVELTKKLSLLAKYINENKDKILSDEEKDFLIIEGQNSVFEAYISDKVQFQQHLNLYLKNKESRENKRKQSYTKKPTNINWRSALGVSGSASKEEVDKAYRDLVKRYHPDINKDPGAKEQMYKINEAKDLADKYFETA